MQCHVCGRTATGVHYGVLACEGCKAFYRRGVESNITYFCYFGNACITNTNTRACCKSCRFYKCVSLGMKINGSRLRKYRPSDTQSEEVMEGKKKKRAKSAEKIGLPFSTLRRATREAATETDEFSIMSNSKNDEQQWSVPSSTVTLPGEVGWTDVPLTEIAALQELDNNETVGSEACLSLANRKSQTTEVIETLGNQPRLVEFVNQWAKMLDENRRQMALTIHSVTIAVEVVFRDQISRWKTCMERAINYGEDMYQPENTLEMLTEAVKYHKADSVIRTHQFVSMLPGIAELNGHFAVGKMTIGWKALAVWMLHLSPFLKNGQSYVTIGLQQFHYSRYWQDLLFERPLVEFIHQFCAEFNYIGLTETETYLLLAVIMSEQVEDDQNCSLTKNLTLIHRHYTDVLFDMIKRRCSDNFQLTSTCRKLGRFFSAVKFIHRLHRHYFRVLDMSQAPFRAVKGDRLVSVLDALCFNEKKNRIEELEPEFHCLKRIVEF